MPRSEQRSGDAERLRRAKLGAYDYEAGERPTPPPQPPASLVERRIREAMAAGAFDHLPGHGKPLNLTRNPFVDPGLELAFHVLGNAGCAPEWIERRKELEKLLGEARTRAARAVWNGQLTTSGEQRLAEDLVAINRKIDGYNIAVPIAAQRRAKLRIEDERRRALDQSR